MEAQEIHKEVPLLNPMAFYPGFPHIAEQIFKQMNKESIRKCRLLSKSWQECIDNQDLLWIKIIEDEDSTNKAFQSAYKNGHSKMVEFLIQKSVKFNINLNAKGVYSWTAFQFACKEGHSKIAEILVQKSNEFRIDINAKTRDHDSTAFHLACEYGHSIIAEMIIQNSVEFNIDLNDKNLYGKTAFHLACFNGMTSTVEMMLDNAKSFKIDLTVKDDRGRTGYQLAFQYNETRTINLIKRKMPSVAVTK